MIQCLAQRAITSAFGSDAQCVTGKEDMRKLNHPNNLAEMLDEIAEQVKEWHAALRWELEDADAHGNDPDPEVVFAMNTTLEAYTTIVTGTAYLRSILGTTVEYSVSPRIETAANR